MKAKQLLILFSVLGLAAQLYFLYDSIFFASLNEYTLRNMVDLIFELENIIIFAGFVLALVMAVLNQKTVAAVGGIIALIMPVYTGIDSGYFEMNAIILSVCAALIVIIGMFYKNLKLK